MTNVNINSYFDELKPKEKTDIKNLEYVHKHINQNIQKVLKKNKFVCIDDRDKSKNTASYPWGEAGKVVTTYTVLQKAGITHKEIQEYLIEKYPRWVSYHWANWHTDNCLHCWDLKLISENYKNYWLEEEWVTFIKTLIKEYNINNLWKITDYKWEHDPSWIIVFEWLDKYKKSQTITSKWNKWKKNFFLLGKWHQKNKVNPELAKELSEKFDIDEKDIEESLNIEDGKHFKNTIWRLGEGLPKYERKHERWKDITTFVWNIWDKTLKDVTIDKETGKSKNWLDISENSLNKISEKDKKYSKWAQSVLDISEETRNEILNRLKNDNQK